MHGLEVVEDPSNRSMKYTRNAVRATVRRLSDADPNLAEGLSIACKHAEELATDARRAGEACFSDTATLDSDSGHAIVDLNALRAHGAASQASTLCRAIQVVTGSNAQASLDTVRQVVDGVLSDGSLTMAPEPRVLATIGGAVLVRAGKSPNTLIVTRQPPRASDHRRCDPCAERPISTHYPLTCEAHCHYTPAHVLRLLAKRWSGTEDLFFGWITQNQARIPQLRFGFTVPTPTQKLCASWTKHDASQISW